MAARAASVGFAGWLFADLLLVLLLVFLGTDAEPPAAATTTTTTTTTAAPPPPTTEPTPPPVVVGVSPDPVVLDFPTDYLGLRSGDPGRRTGAEDQLVELVSAQLGDRITGGERAAFVLSFGFHPTVGEGQRIADSFNQVLATRFPETFGGAALRNFDYRASGRDGTVRAEFYFLLEGSA